MIAPPSDLIVEKYTTGGWKDVNNLKYHFRINDKEYFVHPSFSVISVVVNTCTKEQMLFGSFNWHEPSATDEFLPDDIMAAISLWHGKNVAGLNIYEFLAAMFNEP